MKRKSLLLFIILLVSFLVSCGEETPKDLPVDQKYEAYYNDVIHQFNDGLTDGMITKSIETAYDIIFSDGSEGFVTLVPSDTKYITEEGKYRVNNFGKTITLHATVIKGQEYFEFDFDVYVKGFMKLEDYMESVYALIPDNILTDIQFPTIESEALKTRNAVGKIQCESMNEEVLTNKGEYVIDGSQDEQVTIKVTVTVGEEVFEGSCVRLVCGRRDQEHVANAITWLNENFVENRNATGDLNLPTTDDLGAVHFTYESSNSYIFNNYGEMVNFIANTEVEFKVKATINDYSEYAYIKAKTIDRSQMIEYILDRMHRDTYQQMYLTTYTHSYSGTQFDDYGFLNFYVRDVSEKDLILKGTSEINYVYGKNDSNPNVANEPICKGIVPTTSVNRPGYTKTSVDFITIHDTGDATYDAKGWAGIITTDNREVSWHFTIDQDDIYQHLPLTEVAWHAGDGGNRFGLKDTGVAYAGKNPSLEFKEDDYLYINGIRSNLKTPVEGARTINASGLYTTMGANGNYYINNYYYNSGYKVIANGGGNYNSIGIETCIKDNNVYTETMRNCANLVAHLLRIYNLDISRVLQHRNFSGKLCPQSMIRMGTYDYFIEWINEELFILDNLNGAKFTYTSHNPELVGADGRISQYVTKDTKVSYTVKVEFEDLVFEKTYETIIKPISK